MCNEINNLKIPALTDNDKIHCFRCGETNISTDPKKVTKEYSAACLTCDEDMDLHELYIFDDKKQKLPLNILSDMAQDSCYTWCDFDFFLEDDGLQNPIWTQAGSLVYFNATIRKKHNEKQKIDRKL